MSLKKTAEKTAKFVLINAACAAGLLAVPALAQDAETSDEIVVTGFRASLQSSTISKRNATNFTDSVFAEDIGQMPDLNIAEALNRIPGIQLTREVNGEGLNIAIRGLGTNFTKTLLNGTQISVASSGGADSQNTNREMDLDIFPTELFTRLDVNKTPVASLLEGGVSGTINMRSARPFDYEDSQITYSFQESYGELSEEYSPRGAILASGRWDTGMGEFGLLVGYAAVRSRSVTDGWETIGFTNANLSDAQCGSAAFDHDNNAATAAQNVCNLENNLTAGNGYTIPSTVPAFAGAAGLGLTPGDPVNAALLLSLNPGLTTTQIGNAQLPRLGRPAYFDGNRDRDAVVLSAQFAPSDSVEFYLDVLAAEAHREFNRLDLMFEVRNSNFMIPTQLELDENGIVTHGVFGNARQFLEARPYDEELEFYNVNPGAHFEFGESIAVDLQANMSRSVFFREAPTIGLVLPGSTLTFNSNGDGPPSFTADRDANDPNAGWEYLRLNVQNEKRVTSTQGMHVDVTFGDDANNIRLGAAYDDIERTITGLNADARWENFTCREGTTALTGNPPTRPACAGGPGSAILQADLGDYLLPGPAGFVTPNYDAFFEASNFHFFSNTAGFATGAATGASSGGVAEETLGAYIEANGEAEILERPLRLNAGVRYINTDQVITGPVTIAGVVVFQSLDSNYDSFLPSFNSVLELTDNINLRMSASRTLTRANPNAMLPNTVFSDPSAQAATQGNPNLAPFKSTNFDFGGEWYTGGEGYFGVMMFNKEISGFTVNGTNTINFLDLGIPFDTLSGAQQTAINNRGGPNVAQVTVTQQVNAGGVLNIRGYELTWVQPLDLILEGLGFTANYTRINQSGSGSGAPAIATNVSPSTYNVTGYYENFGFSGRLSYTWADAQQTSLTGNDAYTSPLPMGVRYFDERGQLDAALRYTFEDLPSSPQLTLDAINITSEPRRETQGYDGAVYRYYNPGYTILFGVRGTF